jgi:hypothetical protein
MRHTQSGLGGYACTEDAVVAVLDTGHLHSWHRGRGYRYLSCSGEFSKRHTWLTECTVARLGAIFLVRGG